MMIALLLETALHMWVWFTLLGIARDPVLSGAIHPLHPEDQASRADDGKGQKAEHNGMAFGKSRWRVVHMGAHDAETLAENLSHGPGGAALREARGVDAQPGGQQDHAGIEA